MRELLKLKSNQAKRKLLAAALQVGFVQCLSGFREEGLTLLHLGIQDMRLGPSLPAFVAPNILKVLVEKFRLKPINTPEEDLKAMLGSAVTPNTEHRYQRSVCQ